MNKAIEILTYIINGLLALLKAPFSPVKVPEQIEIPDSFRIPGTSVEDNKQNNFGDKNTERRPIAIPETVTAPFGATGSPAWDRVSNGVHTGTDVGGNEGTPVYAAYDFKVTNVGFYNDAARYGEYVFGVIRDGVTYYSGHLKNVSVKAGQNIKAGTQIGEMNRLRHTHVEIKVNGTPVNVMTYKV